MLILVLLALAIGLLMLRWFLNTDAAVIASVLKRSGLILIITGLGFLLMTGRLNFIIPLFFAMLPIIIPALKRVMNFDGSTNPFSRKSSSMSIEEAYEILDLKPGASRQEIINSHKRLMKKIHPDMGGSTYLAQKLNEAKDLLININR